MKDHHIQVPKLLPRMEFRLLVQTTEAPSQPHLYLEGSHWELSEVLNLQDDEHVPPFACISYLWGAGREPHPLVKGNTMSARTLSSLAAAIRSSTYGAFWTDAFCVPPAGPERQATLESMGYIYSRAHEVIIVLGGDTFPVIEKMLQNGFVTESDLQVLERDEWVSSVWTYQEIVHSALVRFVSGQHAGRAASIDCTDFFSALGFSLSKWRRMVGSDTFASASAFPKLNALEDILADWQVGTYTARAALTIFSSMAHKRNANPANYFYAIVGTLTQSAEDLTWNRKKDLAENMMAICEAKNDFSFIYTATAREVDPSRRWRPRAEYRPPTGGAAPAVLRPIFAWHSWGEAQGGYFDDAGFWLHGMTIMHPTLCVQAAGTKAVCTWLRRPDLQHANDATLGAAIYAAISSVGFEGSASPIVVAEGFVYALETVQTDTAGVAIRVLVSNQIRWTMGAPGLVHIKDGKEKRYVPCMFVGSVAPLLEKGESILL